YEQQKTVQHFPPLSQQQQEHPQQHQEQFDLLPPPSQTQLLQFHRQRGKQSKVNLTPFTAQNTLPGHFIPIIYTPLSKLNSNSNSNSNNNNNINNDLHNGNPINYNKNQSPSEIVYHKNSHPTQIVTDYASSDSQSPEEEAQQQQEKPMHPTPSVGYNDYNEPAVVTATTSSSATSQTSSSSSTSSTKTALIVHQKSPEYVHMGKYESYFNMSPEQQLTPQEKYVLYLQQRMKQQRQQHQQQQHQHQQQSKHHQQEQYHHPADDLHHHQSAQSNTKAGKLSHSHTTHTHVQQSPPQPQTPPPPPPPHHHTQLHNYNGLFGRPEAAQAGHQQQQVLHIPLRALIGQLHEQPKDTLLGTPAPTHFIDYLVDGPRQSLDEEQQQHQQQHTHPYPHQQPHPHQPLQVPPSRPPQHAYILVTTTAPYIDHPAHQPPRLHDLPPTRPPVRYKQQPTLRLQPVTPVHNYQATRRPVYISPPTPSETVKITPKYVYVSSRPPSVPPSSDLPSRTVPQKLKPIHKYANERQPAPPKSTPSEVYATATATATDDEADQLPDIRTSSLAEILHKLQASNHLPQTLTPNNIDNSIKTLIRILQNLKETQTIVPNPPQHHETKPSSSGNSHDYDYTTGSEEEPHSTAIKTAGNVDADLLHLSGPNKHPGPSTGRAGIDYPNYAQIPKTSFECTQQRYKGFFGDPETNCQVWHYCDLNGGKASFLCPNGTIFSQIALTCDWWFNVKCSTTSQLYVLNERLYKYILPFNPKFPEDYNGPIVDKYLAMKFQEMEEKMRLEKQRKADEQAEKPTVRNEEAASNPAMPKNHKPEPKHGSAINAQVYEQSSERNLLIDDEIDDISERGTYDTYGQAPTTIMVPTTTAEDGQSFNRRPIVVPSTPEPETELEAQPETQLDTEPEPEPQLVLDGEPPESSVEEENKLQILRDTNAAAAQKQVQTTKVSVEKLEVIEIKTDGKTGQLMPIASSM
ncbi:GH19216, partial [Drosophila grimshawi]